MSYDIYCYKSAFDKPDLEEAQTVIEVDDNVVIIPDSEVKLRIVQALMAYNPRLEKFDFDYNEIARLQGISVDEARRTFSHIELNTPEEDLATQITIFDDNVSIKIPYWYSGAKVKEAFDKINEYTRIIRKTAGYFVYDPQTEQVIDPLDENISGLGVYQNMTGQLENIKRTQSTNTGKKTWWKFW